ncbi:DUF488 domain-containing protein [Micromonospora echinofusca]|uniref:DUF488 domain-containing protein n=1 Tax=Micromonospora echinofusca TaxID=47858 RepID=UPI001AD770B2|nr:DUF488 domain-containing protein [Micromonospora echinofusca]
MKIYTIGFTRKSASQFFETLRSAQVKRVVDVRLNNVSQLAGFAKRHDLEYFLREIGSIRYTHALDLAPTQDMLDAYKKGASIWGEYEARFVELIQGRHVEVSWANELRDGDCFLCSEEQPQNCHRRLVAEYFADHFGKVEIKHLV